MQQTQREVPGCAAECDRLIAIADAMPALVDRRRLRFSAWYRTVYELAAATDLESFESERKLDAYATDLRRLWMATAHEFADATFRSPLAANVSELPRSKPIAYDYERTLEDRTLEKRIAAYRPAPPGWRGEHLLYSSGMAAIGGAFTALPRLLARDDDGKLVLAAATAYFETVALLDVGTPGIDAHVSSSEDALFSDIMRYVPDAVYVEPIVYDTSLEPLDLLRITRTLGALERPPALIVDSTLVGPTVPLARVLEPIRDRGVPFVIQISSGLKLDQEGLELANVGIVSVFVPDTTPPLELTAIVDHLRTLRRLAGTALGLDAIALLDVSFFLDAAAFYGYTDAVFAHNAGLADRVPEGGLFSRVVHPARSRRRGNVPWAVAPFVMLHLAQDTVEHARTFEAIVESEVRRRGIALERGGSFGFRSHRFEAIALENAERQAIVKIALGARRGPSLDAIGELLAEFALCRDMAELQRRFS